MADDTPVDDPDEEIAPEEVLDDDDVVLDEEGLEVVDLEDELIVEGGADEAVGKDDEEEEEEPAPAARKKARDDDEDEDEDEVDPDDVEADLDTILKDRIAATPDEEEDEEEQPEDKSEGEAAGSVQAKKEGEFTCMGCFMIVHPRQFGRRDNPRCPTGNDDCPSIQLVLAGKGP